MNAADEGSLEQTNSVPTYEEALDFISSLIIRRTRADGANKGDQFDFLFAYLKMLELEDSLSHLRVIHVAGTKGKGSTCTFTESILRSCGFHTGLFTSPHLIDLRERFKIDGVEISEEKFLAYFWWCWNRLKERTNENVPMPNYFRFLALLAFKIFTAEQVDVAILEVGLGGKFDATNVVHAPVVCGVSSLGYDHMEILGNTLGEIAGEKAGIFKHGVPAFTAPQLREAMLVLENKASELHIPLQVAPPLDISLLNGRQLGLAGEHQYINAGLAVALCRTWLQKKGHPEGLDQDSCLPEQFIKGLETASLQGRAQIVSDLRMGMESQFTKSENNSKIGNLIFYLDGAHSPESMEVCARWFSCAIKDSSETNSLRILLFNCMPVRDPQLLLPHLINTCAHHGIHFNKAIFVPNQSVFNKVGSHSLTSNDPPQVDLSWQMTLQRVWENLVNDDIGAGKNRTMDSGNERRDAEPHNIEGSESSMVFPSLPLALKWLRESAQHSQSNHFQVLVTGSLYLVGDVLRLIGK